MSNSEGLVKMLVLTRRIKMPGIVETMSEQVPEVKIAFAEIEGMLKQHLNVLGEANWRVISHAHNILNGILIVSIMLEARHIVET
ncbi:MAG: hypothetical protein E4G99_13090 [Anaerolineales bacterium]|nr:hypothetical protein [Anaerolineales bacterium]TFH32146.1 MAG: hypothetical protein E4G99_13090 [Anaerolineales bacterium]